jgi:hypothetical protein
MHKSKTENYVSRPYLLTCQSSKCQGDAEAGTVALAFLPGQQAGIADDLFCRPPAYRRQAINEGATILGILDLEL